MDRSRRALQRTSMLALAICLLAQLAGSVHSAAVQHVACREHGGIVELHTARTVSPPVAHETIAPDDEAVHHAHCACCATPTARRVALSALPGARLPGLRVTVARPRAHDCGSTGRFRLAPKGSPPTALLS